MTSPTAGGAAADGSGRAGKTGARGPLRRRLRLVFPALLLVVASTGCDPSFGWPKAITPQGHRMRDLWIGSCFAASVVGLFVVGLMVFAMIAYRKRDDEMPRQIQYNLPIEMLYTVVPFVIVAALFFYTAKDEVYVLKTTASPAKHGVMVIDVEGFQWGWTFRYISESHQYGVPSGDAVFVTGSSNTTEPTLVLPTGVPIQFQEHSNNVIHSFWVPQLLFKIDVIPGRTNKWQISDLERTGTFDGHCAELCGYDHARMNFNMKSVSQADFDTWMKAQVAKGATEPIPDWVLTSTPTGSVA